MKSKFLRISVVTLTATVLLFAGCGSSTKKQQNRSGVETEVAKTKRVPMIYSTDLFQPCDDPDDNYDIALLFNMEEIDIKALIFDQAAKSAHWKEVGKTALEQLSKITGKTPPPWKIGIRNPMRSVDDKALDQAEEFQGGVALILSTLEQSDEQVVMFLVGSCRDFAVAFNRNPELLREKVKAVYVCAGNGPKGVQNEYNVGMDPYAYTRLMFSGLPIYWSPCFTDNIIHIDQPRTPDDVSAGTVFCSHYIIPNQAEFLASCSKMVRNYFAYTLNRLDENPLVYLDRDEPAPLPETIRNVWCTAPFLHAAGRKIYRTDEGQWIACTPEKAKLLGINSPAVKVYQFEPIRLRYTMNHETPEFYDAINGQPVAPIQVFRYIHRDYNEIMGAVQAQILNTL